MAGVATGRSRVLIVDDNADIRTVVAARLHVEPAFVVVGEAATGAEAIARTGELRPDLMVLDLQMPVMSGEEVIPIIRSLAPDLGIVVFSAYAGTHHRLQRSERPDAEVRKGQGSGLEPLVAALRSLVAEPPLDLLRVDLGRLDVEDAVRAGHAWVRLNAGLRAAAVGRGATADFLSLVGVFLALGEPLQRAARTGRATAATHFRTRLEVAVAARRALAGVGEAEAALLEPLRARLLHALPQAHPDGVLP